MTTTYQHQTGRPSKGPKLLFKIGLIFVVINVVTAIISVALIGPDELFADDDKPRTREALIADVAVPGVVEVHLEADTYDIVAIGPDLVRRDEFETGRGDNTQPAAYLSLTPFPEPDVTITRDGLAVPTSRPTGKTLFMLPGYDLVTLRSFDVSTAGTYLIEAAEAPGPVTAIGVGVTDDPGHSSVTRGAGGLLLVFSALGFGFGVLLMMAAGLWRVADRKNRPTPGSSPNQPLPPPPPWEQPPTLRR